MTAEKRFRIRMRSVGPVSGIALSVLLSPVLAVALFGVPADARANEPAAIDFARDIQPILSNHCWNCHGPDSGSREAGLRLDQRDAAISLLESGDTAIVPGKPERSSLLHRIESTDESLVMPPAETQKPLSRAQVELLKRWIADGAEYSGHWAFQAPVRPELPAVTQADWPRNGLDRFILKRLEERGLHPSPPADPVTWLRRVTLDLTGLPPTPEEIQKFLQDQQPGAEERVVDRLLNSTRHAERMAMQWLDAARYADTNGYNNDEVRTMWPWRDWLIDSFSRGMPYDQFLTEQLAGDLLPEASRSQKVATGFNRNHVLTTEGGIVEEEYHLEYVADRVHTTATVFLGLSMQCARCHDHKFDPISQREYYQFSAYFNNVPDRGVGYNRPIPMAEPLLKVPSPQQEAEQQQYAARLTELAANIDRRALEVDSELADWERSLTTEQKSAAFPTGLVASFLLDELSGTTVSNSLAPAAPGEIQGEAKQVRGRFGNGLEFDGKTKVVAGDVGRFEGDQSFTLSAWVWPTSKDPTTVLSRIDEANGFRGYDLILEGGKVASHFVHHWPDKGFKVITKEPIPLNAWHHIAVTYDGSRDANGMTIYVDGVSVPYDVTNNNRLAGTLITETPFHIGQRRSSAPFQGKIDEVQLFDRRLAADEISELASETSLASLTPALATPAEQRTPEQVNRLRQYYLDQLDPALRQWKEDQTATQTALTKLNESIPVTMIMEEMSPRRKTYLLNRGQYDQRQEEVHAGIPEALRGADSTDIPDRLALARWLTNPRHPLTSRVAVNRWWEICFGTGLVETSEDFGIQGTPPTHPELLDWLACELMENGWSHRQILKTIVLSATYRQSSKITPELLERDPQNRLLARGPRYRLPVEMVRDNALSISGLLSERVGGPSVRPYQPDGLWEEVSVERRDSYVPDSGEGLYRRSMYTFWKRTCAPPSMAIFDAPDRETCLVRRARTNTPLQALVLLNDPTYVEAARRFAEHVMDSSTTDSERLNTAFQRAICRDCDATERATLLAILDETKARFTADRSAAEQFLQVGQSRPDPSRDTAELAAWSIVCSLILNLDETISKQ